MGTPIRKELKKCSEVFDFEFQNQTGEGWREGESERKQSNTWNLDQFQVHTNTGVTRREKLDSKGSSGRQNWFSPLPLWPDPSHFTWSRWFIHHKSIFRYILWLKIKPHSNSMKTIQSGEPDGLLFVIFYCFSMLWKFQISRIHKTHWILAGEKKVFLKYQQ